MAQSKRMVNDQISQYKLLNKKKLFVQFSHFSMRQRNITIVTSYRSPCSLGTWGPTILDFKATFIFRGKKYIFSNAWKLSKTFLTDLLFYNHLPD